MQNNVYGAVLQDFTHFINRCRLLLSTPLWQFITTRRESFYLLRVPREGNRL